jgi:crossover junction endodeoxyribonuclease RuvC
VRLLELHEGLTSIIREHRPSNAVVEKVFFAKSVKSALTLGQARGIALLAAASERLEVHEYSALEVKKAVTGYGRAEKRQVQEMVKKVLNVRGSLSPDGADALAIAMCHIQRMQFERSVKSR